MHWAFPKKKRKEIITMTPIETNFSKQILFWAIFCLLYGIDQSVSKIFILNLIKTFFTF